MNSDEKKHITEVWPGPMEGVMKKPFIQTAAQLKLTSRWMTPFFRVSSHVPGKKLIAEFLEPFLETGLPVSGQIMGTNAVFLAETAKIMLACGCCEVNFNCGCPSARVVSGNAGGGALKNLQTLSCLLKHLRQNIPDGRFSVKCRTGYDRPRISEVLQNIIDNGQPDRLTVHFRCVKELYDPVDDFENRFEDIISVARQNRVSLILNGDINSVQTANRLAEKAGNCGIMCARYWMKDPGLLKRIEGENIADADTIRKTFFETFLTFNSARGAALEIARMLWGTNSDHFQKLLKQ